MKLVFLDYDGVIALASVRPRRLESKLVANLSRLCEQTGAGVVISSSWRYDTGRATEALRAAGFSGAIVGRTALGENRPGEIRAWLRDRLVNVESFVILDDNWIEDLEKAFPGRVVATDPERGLGTDEVSAAASVLGRGVTAVERDYSDIASFAAVLIDDVDATERPGTLAGTIAGRPQLVLPAGLTPAREGDGRGSDMSDEDGEQLAALLNSQGADVPFIVGHTEEEPDPRFGRDAVGWARAGGFEWRAGHGLVATVVDWTRRAWEKIVAREWRYLSAEGRAVWRKAHGLNLATMRTMWAIAITPFPAFTELGQIAFSAAVDERATLPVTETPSSPHAARKERRMDPNRKRALCAALKAVGVDLDPEKATDDEVLAATRSAFPEATPAEMAAKADDGKASMAAADDKAACATTTGTAAMSTVTRTEFTKVLDERDERIRAAAAKEAIAAFETRTKAEKAQREIDEMLDAAERDGKFAAEARSDYAAFALANFDATKRRLAAMPKVTQAGTRDTDPYRERGAPAGLHGTESGTAAFSTRAVAIVAGKDHAGLKSFLNGLTQEHREKPHFHDVPDRACSCLPAFLSRAASYHKHSGVPVEDAIEAVAGGSDASFEASIRESNPRNPHTHVRDFWAHPPHNVRIVERWDPEEVRAKRDELRSKAPAAFGTGLSSVQAPASSALAGGAGFGYAQGTGVMKALFPEIEGGKDEQAYYLRRGKENFESLSVDRVIAVPSVTAIERRFFSMSVEGPIKLDVYGHEEIADKRQVNALQVLGFSVLPELTKEAILGEDLRQEKIHVTFAVNLSNYAAANQLATSGTNLFSHPDCDVVSLFNTAHGAVQDGTLGRKARTLVVNSNTLRWIRNNRTLAGLAGLYQATKGDPALPIPVQTLASILDVDYILEETMYSGTKPDGSDAANVLADNVAILAYTGAGEADPINPRHAFCLTSAGYPWIEPFLERSGAIGSHGVQIAVAHKIISPGSATNAGRYIFKPA